MIAAQPLDAFLVGTRQILICRLPGDDPESLRGRDLAFITPGCNPKRIQIVEWSTASDVRRSVYDLQYTGDRIQADDITDRSFLSDAEDIAQLTSERSKA